MGNCKSRNSNIIQKKYSYLLYDSCNEQTKERVNINIDKRIEDAISKDKYDIGFSLKTFFLPENHSENSFFNYFDIYMNIDIKEKDCDESILKDIYVPYNIIIQRLKRFINYSYSIHHSYWYIQYEHIENKKYFITNEPYHLQNIEGNLYKWHGLLHITKIHSNIPSISPIND